MESEFRNGNFKTTIIKICNFEAVDIHKARNHWLKTINLENTSDCRIEIIFSEPKRTTDRDVSSHR